MKPIELRGHTRPVNVIKLNYDGDLFFTGGADKKVNLWYSINGERLGSFDTKSAVKTLDITENTEILIVGSLDGSIEFFKINGGQKLGEIKKNEKIKFVELS